MRWLRSPFVGRAVACGLFDCFRGSGGDGREVVEASVDISWVACFPASSGEKIPRVTRCGCCKSCSGKERSDKGGGRCPCKAGGPAGAVAFVPWCADGGGGTDVDDGTLNDGE